MFWEQNVRVAVETHIGLRRKNNEDSSCYQLCQNEEQWQRRGHLFVVADGMGGHAVGELASRIAVETLPHTFFKTTDRNVREGLADAVVAANEAIYKRGSTTQDFLHMGTTCTALTLCSRGAIVGHVGDSRAYRIRRDRIDQLTFDHSLEWEIERRQHSIPHGTRASQHRNVITRSLGPEASVEVDIEGPYPVLPGDAFLLCSDGLSNQVEDEEIGAIVRALSPQKAATLLINLANIRGGPDNSTVVVAQVGEPPKFVQPQPVYEDDPHQLELDWSWFIGFSAAAVAFAVGLMMFFFGHKTKGLLTAGLAVMSFLIMAYSVFRKLKELKKLRGNDDGDSTQIMRPHRTSVCLDSRELYERLSAIENDLRRAAQEDGWGVNWKRHEELNNSAQRSASERRFGRATRYVSDLIDLIMKQLPLSTTP